jgi:uncharacterized protein (TIGR00369 family)
MKNNILQQLLQLVPFETSMELPPKVFIDMEGEFIEFVENERLVARFPNKERYMNPFGFMQGGILVAAMDNTISPLSYVTAPPSITKEINATYKRPIKQCDHFIDVVATVLEKTATYISLQAEVLNEKGKLAAKCVANCVYIKGIRS